MQEGKKKPHLFCNQKDYLVLRLGRWGPPAYVNMVGQQGVKADCSVPLLQLVGCKVIPGQYPGGMESPGTAVGSCYQAVSALWEAKGFQPSEKASCPFKPVCGSLGGTVQYSAALAPVHGHQISISSSIVLVPPITTTMERWVSCSPFLLLRAQLERGLRCLSYICSIACARCSIPAHSLISNITSYPATPPQQTDMPQR